MRAGWAVATDFFHPLDQSLRSPLFERLATLAWSNKHGKLQQSVRDGVQEADEAEIAAIQAAASREAAREPEPPPAEPEPAPLP